MRPHLRQVCGTSSAVSVISTGRIRNDPSPLHWKHKPMPLGWVPLPPHTGQHLRG